MAVSSSDSNPGSMQKPAAANSLSGRRILVVEDEFLLGYQLEELLRSLGCAVIGPFRNLDDGLAAAQRETFDLAILDINLGGTMVYPLADHLIASGIPFMFLSGYGTANLPERFRAITRVNKPYDEGLLVRTLQSQL